MLELLRFTLPTLSALLSSEVMSVIDTAVVGASSSTELCRKSSGQPRPASRLIRAGGSLRQLKA
eukprot:scaffold52284_cov51-Phaeocystis_antarctica.AAC.3